jgi:hypothetical protein
MPLKQSILQGSLRFATVSVLAYAIWALGGSMGTTTLYAGIAGVFVILSGLLMFPLLKGTNRIARFYAAFIPGFLLYAILWCAGWFGIRGNPGELLGSAAGLAGLTCILMFSFRTRDVFLPVFGVLFTFHTLGYTFGGMCYYASHGKGILAPVLESKVALGRLLWGLFHGLGFGAGLGYAFYKCQAQTSDS